MSSSMETYQSDQIAQFQGGNNASQVGQAMSYRIKRAGARPLAFKGSELAMAMSYTPTLPYWYEINIYRTTNNNFVVAIKLFFQSEDEQDTAHAWRVDSLEEALTHIESYDAAQDVRVQPIAADAEMSAAELAAYAAQLRAEMLASRRHYASLAGQFFHDLDNGE